MVKICSSRHFSVSFNSCIIDVFEQFLALSQVTFLLRITCFLCISSSLKLTIYIGQNVFDFWWEINLYKSVSTEYWLAQRTDISKVWLTLDRVWSRNWRYHQGSSPVVMQVPLAVFLCLQTLPLGYFSSWCQKWL